MNSRKEYEVCQTLGIVLDVCPTCHILDYVMLNILTFFVCVSLYELGNSRNLINSVVTWKDDDDEDDVIFITS